MKIQDRIKAIEKWLNDFYGYTVCNGCLINIKPSSSGKKIVVSLLRNAVFIRERKIGRGIQAMRIVNHLSGKNFFKDKTLILGKDDEET